jgi:hypothetical protein
VFENITKHIIAPMILVMIMNGVITSADQLKHDVNQRDWDLLSACMQLENANNGDECLLLTGSVPLNRAYYCSWCPDTIEGVLYQKGQYASNTVKNLETVIVNDHIRLLAKYLLIYGPICPPNVVFQSQQKNLGSKHYRVIETPDGPEYFAYE